MTTTTASAVREVEVLRQQGRMAHQVVRMNVEGLTQADSLIRP